MPLTVLCFGRYFIFIANWIVLSWMCFTVHSLQPVQSYPVAKENTIALTRLQILPVILFLPLSHDYRIQPAKSAHFSYFLDLNSMQMYYSTRGNVGHECGTCIQWKYHRKCTGYQMKYNVASNVSNSLHVLIMCKNVVHVRGMCSVGLSKYILNEGGQVLACALWAWVSTCSMRVDKSCISNYSGGSRGGSWGAMEPPFSPSILRCTS